MNGHQRIIAALERRQPDRVPTFEWFIDRKVTMVLAGTEDPLDAVEALDIDGVNVRADYTRTFTSDTDYVDEWGTTRRITGEALAAAIDYPVPDITRQREFRMPRPDAPGRFASLEKALRRFEGKRAIVLNLRDGFSDMREILGYENCLIGMMIEEGHFADLLDRVVDYNLALARIARERYHMPVVAMTDDIANEAGLLFNPEVYFRLIAPRFRRVVQGYKSLGYLTIKHSDGDITSVIDWWLDSGVDCVDPVDPAAGLDLADFKKKYGARACLKGNVNCTGPLANGPEAAITAEVRRCIAAGAPGGGFILSSSNTIHSGVPPANYAVMLKALREHGRYTGRRSIDP
jgi:uroporphyrinogen decarboxylase